jgi:hypothetical protein
MNRGTKTKRKNEALKAPEKAFPEKKIANSHSASNYSIIMQEIACERLRCTLATSLPLATRRHFTNKISSKIKQNNPSSRENQKTPTYRRSMFPPRILQLRKKRRIRPLEILKKDREKKTLRNYKDSTNANPAERRNRRARDSTTHTPKIKRKKLLFETFSKHHETKRRKI